MVRQEDFSETNRRAWEELARIHALDRTGFYRIQAFLAGENTLYPIEKAEVGEVAGKTVAHLQCHIGLDSLNLARMGAEVTGLDFSAEAVAQAGRFSERIGVPATFVQGNVYDADKLLKPASFDLVYVTWGAIPWLPDIRRWTDVVANLLRPGGELYLLETHPATECLHEENGRLVARYDWRSPADKPIEDEASQSYTGDEIQREHGRTYNWIHSFTDIMGGLLANGLTITAFQEHEALPYALFPMMEEGPDRLFRLPEGQPRLPLSFSLRARA